MRTLCVITCAVIDETSKLRKSHENASVSDIYTKYFGSPNSEKAHHLLHTHYHNRKH